MAKARDPIVLTIGLVAVRALYDNDKRKVWFVQNRGPGVLYWGPNQTVTTTAGHRVPVDSYFVDDICPHDGEVWFIADTANTIAVVGETT